MSLLKKYSLAFLIILQFIVLSCESQATDKTESVANKAQEKAKEVAKKIVDSPEAQLKEVMRIWPGTYNNDQQIEQIKKEGKDVWLVDDSGKDGYLHLQSHYIKLDLPAIGENVLYVEEYRDHKPEETYRQRIYTLFVDSTGTMVKVKMWPFKDKKKYVGAWKDPSLLVNLTTEEVSAYPDFCDMHVRKVDEKYHMKFNGKDCAFGDKCFNYEVMLSENVFSYRDKITVLSTGELVSTAADFAYHDLNRIKD